MVKADRAMRFEFATATRILFGRGVIQESIPAIAALGRRLLVVTGQNAERARPLLDRLKGHVDARVQCVTGEPTLAQIEEASRLARAERIEAVVGMGGGSAIDAGKAIAALAANDGALLDYLEVIGRAQPLERAPLPVVAIPTTAGTGAEVTRNAVLSSPEHQVKVSLRSPLMLPRLAVVDPELTLGLPPALTASTGLDALTQLIEPLVSVRANPFTDGFCREGIVRVARSLARACAFPNDIGAREDMALASLLSGLALANAGLGAVHGFAAAIGGMFPAPHGAICAALLPQVMAVNLHACRERLPASDALARFDEVGRLLTGRTDATADDAVDWVRRLCEELGVPPLSTYGLRPEHAPAVCAKAAQASSMKGNPVALSPTELEEMLLRS